MLKPEGVGAAGAVMPRAEDQFRYALAGDATLTLRSLVTGRHLTFRVWVPGGADGDRSRRGVSVLGDGDRWVYVGMVFRDGDGDAASWGDLSPTKASKVRVDSPSFKAFAFFWAHVARGRDAPDLEVRHEGHCGRCGRELTHPASLETGLGPECSAALGVPRAVLRTKEDVNRALQGSLGLDREV